jgi:tetratricopeptide (TPR) repeat protein
MSRSLQSNAKLLNMPQALAQALELHRHGRLTEAEQLYAGILAVRPDHFDALHMLGMIRLAQGQFSEALRLIAGAMQSKTPSPQILLNYGLVLNALDRHQEALESFDHAIKLKSKFSEAHNNRAAVLAALGRDEEALESYRKALAITPNYPQAHYNLGNSLRMLGRNEEAVKSYDRALVLRPDYTEALYNRGNTLRELKRFDEAMASYDRSLSVRPDFAEALYNRGNTLRELKRFDEALASYDRALSVQPDYFDALCNRGNALRELKRFDEELASYDRALSIRPDDAGALNNRGNALSALGRHIEALATISRAIAVNPASTDAQLNDALLKLRLGDFSRGWEKYEWRWKRDDGSMKPRNFGQPLWLGQEPVVGKTILLHAEQGLGDTIQFARYAPMLAKRDARVILEVQPPLKSLFSQIGSGIQIISNGEIIPSFDLHCPLMSLPLAFRTELGTIPADAPYLAVLSDRIEQWNDRLPSRNGLRVGIVWSGNASHVNDHNRSISLPRLAPIIDLPYIQFISLQKEMREADARILAQKPHIIGLGSHFGDFTDTAATITQVDLVISVDTSVAHLAGALGKPVWILLPFCPDWRWLLDREDSPWYPSARLFRQPHIDDWDSVIEQVRRELSLLADSHI